MKKLLIALCMLGTLAACEKTELKSGSAVAKEIKDTKAVQSSTEKEVNKRKWKNCTVYMSGQAVGQGETCSDKGNECGRKPYCKLGYSSFADDEIVFDDITYKEFAEMWNSDEGRIILQDKGAYEKIDD